jgi:hypothetical protein
MGQAFDAYHKWLGIPPDAQPPNHYRLLGIALYEQDPDVIDAASCRQMAHLRTYQLSQHAVLSQKLLNEVAAARICLLDPQKKATYDAHLKAHLTVTALEAELEAEKTETCAGTTIVGFPPVTGTPPLVVPPAPAVASAYEEWFPSAPVISPQPLVSRRAFPVRRRSRTNFAPAFIALAISAAIGVLVVNYGWQHNANIDQPAAPRQYGHGREGIAKTLAASLQTAGFSGVTLAIRWSAQPAVSLSGRMFTRQFFANIHRAEGAAFARSPGALAQLRAACAMLAADTRGELPVKFAIDTQFSTAGSATARVTGVFVGNGWQDATQHATGRRYDETLSPPLTQLTRALQAAVVEASRRLTPSDFHVATTVARIP